ncbi:TolC family outer membrane protein [Phenylobacterium immobile]|uniref:TolC family outer membrane protein n=1 Tax=Phenylobacterium immobile TaxID=21 RepID=UPI000A99D17A|nr:TolC family outer membrane protein [Phenylobacterium immobile]
MSNRFRARLVAAMVTTGLAGILVAGSGAQAKAETLAEAIAMAYRNNPNLEAQRATQRALDETYVQARSGWRPTLTASASATYSESRGRRRVPYLANYDETNSATIGLTFNQPLWTGGRVAAAVTAANADVLSGQESLRRVEAQVMAAVIAAYADVRRDTAALEIQRQNLATLQRQLDESNARFTVGELTRTDVALSQARLSASQAQLSSAQAQLEVSRANYAALVGQNPGDLAGEPSLSYLMPATPEEAFEVAEKFSPLLRAQQFAEEASRARVVQARADRNPSLSVSATYGHTGPADPFERGLYDREVVGRATVTVPLFTGGLTTSRIRQQIERNNADRITVETQRRSVLQTVTQTWNLLTAARANIIATAEQVRAARIATEGTRQELQVGLRTTLDVLNTEQERRAAELNQVTARRDEYVASANLLAAMGRLEARNLTPDVPQYDAKANFRRLRVTWGWVPWEEPLGVIDRLLSPSPLMTVRSRAVEPSIGPGLQAAPGATAPIEAPPKAAGDPPAN